MSSRCRSAIMASKLYQASPRKNKILAAIANPANAELVVQLEEYIGDEFKELLTTKEKEPDTESVATETESAEPEKNKGSERPNSDVRDRRPSPIRPTEPKDSEQPIEDEDTKQPSDPYDYVPEEVLNAPVQNSTAAVCSNINASWSGGVVNGHSYEAQIDTLAGELRGTLNARQSTAGVSRVNVKNDEIWMFYDESINLNNVLSEVINLLNAAGYYYVKFNRLARTDNAIVFTLEFNDASDDSIGIRK